MINEGNKQDEYLEKKGESSKDSAMRKASSRRGRFSSGETHQNAERENITWARPGTRPYADSLDRQRKSAHRDERGRKNPQAGSSPEDRRWAEFSGDKPEGKYQKLQKAKKSGQRTNIEAQKQGLIRKGERRRELRTQAVNAIRRAVGGGYVSEAKVDDRLSADQKEIIRNRRLPITDRLPVRGETSQETAERITQKRRDRNKRDRGGQTVRGSQLPKYKKHAEYGGITYQKDWKPEIVSARRDELRAKRTRNNIRDFERNKKTFEEFMLEASKGKSPRPTVLPKSRERDIGKHDDWRDPHPDTRDFGERPEAGKKLRRRAMAVVGTRRREDEETGVREDFVPLTPDKEERVKTRVGELARDIQLHGARIKELKGKPFGKFRPKVRKEKKAIVKSARKKAKQVRSASDALIHASTSRQANTQRNIEDLKQKLRDLGEEP